MSLVRRLDQSKPRTFEQGSFYKLDGSFGEKDRLTLLKFHVVAIWLAGQTLNPSLC